jgi:uncharacterized SAM-binding protein YcdF (DUF218 family)
MWYPPVPYRPAPVEAIVVFAAGVDPPNAGRPYALPDAETWRRCAYAAWLHHHVQRLPVLVSGGASGGAPPAALIMRELLGRAGISESMIWTETESRNTHENALYSARALKERGIARVTLVVDAYSMLRAERCFRKLGIQVTPAPSSFRTFGRLSEELMPGWKSIARNELSLHEAGGLLWYRLRGWI